MTEKKALEIKHLYEKIMTCENVRDKIKYFYKRKENLNKISISVESKYTEKYFYIYDFELNDRAKRKVLMLLLRESQKEIKKAQKKLGEIK